MSSPVTLCGIEPNLNRSLDEKDEKFDRSIPLQARITPVVSTLCGSIPLSTGIETPHVFSTTTPCQSKCSTTPRHNLAPTFSPSQEATHTSQPSIAASTAKPAPIPIPTPRLRPYDINRVPTPLSARGERKAHLFPFECSRSRSPSPATFTPRSPRRIRRLSNESDNFFGRLERVRSTSTHSTHRIRSFYHANMLDLTTANRYPASPLSSRPPPRTLAISPTPGHRRGNHGRQASRSGQVPLGRYHPSNFPQADLPASLAAATTQAPPPSIMYTRVPVATQVESPRLLRENYRVFLEKEKLSSKLAASPLAVKPDAPRLDPLGSPKGPMTPLELAEDANDYFGVVGTGRISPGATPGNKSPRSNSLSSYEDTKPNKVRKVDLYM